MRKSIFMTLSILWMPLFLSGPVAGSDQSLEETFFKANQACKEGRFQDAADGYSSLIRSGFSSGHLFFNLGNAYFRLNSPGRAILNYERARLLIPRDPDLRFNLDHARDQIQDAVSNPDSFIGAAFFWLESLTQQELFWMFAISNGLFWATLVMRLFFRVEWSYYLFLVVLALWLVAGLSFVFKWYEVKNDDRAVILHREVDVLSGPDVSDTVLFKLHTGTIVHFERSEDGWSLIHLQDKKRRGWVKGEAIEKIILENTIDSPPPSQASPRRHAF